MDEKLEMEIEETLPADEDVLESDEAADLPDQEVIEEAPEDDVVVYTSDNPMPVTIIEPAAEETELEVFAVSGSYPGTISTTYLAYFEGIVQKLLPNQHYVVYRSGQNAYTMVYGEDIALDGFRFTGSGHVVDLYRNSSSSSNDWYVGYSEDSISLDAGSLYVYSDLGMFPTLKKGGSALEFTAVLFVLAFFTVCSVCHHIFDDVLQHMHRK